VGHDDVAAQLQTGKAVLHSCLDNAGRPAVVIRARKHIIGALHVDSYEGRASAALLCIACGSLNMGWLACCAQHAMPV
jgi:hypothetical protein